MTEHFKSEFGLFRVSDTEPNLLPPIGAKSLDGRYWLWPVEFISTPGNPETAAKWCRLSMDAFLAQKEPHSEK